MDTINLLDFDREGLIHYFKDALGEKPFRATQVMQWVHQQGVLDFHAMTNLSKALRQRLADHASLAMPDITITQQSQDGTRKWLLQLENGNAIEAVFIPEEDRNTLCISSQVGCALDCSFCATAQQGFNRNLTTGEILAQLWIAEHTLRNAGYQMDNQQRVISNIVLMGMGEPLTNFNNVVNAMRVMMDDYSYGLSWRRITLSTAGVVPGILRLREHCPVNLAISLHATHDELRNQLVPINKKYPIARLLEACRTYLGDDHRKKITFEYIMLHNLNDQPRDAKALVKLLQGMPAKVNLIPFNPFPGSHYQRSTPAAIEQFRDILLRAGIMTVTRRTRGDDIAAACGQLAGQVQDKTRRHLRYIPIQQEERVNAKAIG